MDDAAQRKSILAVVGDRGLFGRLAARLNRTALEVNLSHSAQTAMFFASILRFELIFLGHPLSDATLPELLDAIHRPGSPCADTAVLVLADRHETPILRRCYDGELVEVVAVDDLGGELEERVNRRLGLGALTSRRVTAGLTATVRAGDRGEPLTSVNLSESGILLHCDRPLPVGTRVELDLLLPGERYPLRLHAEVVRHALPEQEGIEGMGLRFVDLRDFQRVTLRRFVAERLRDQDGAASAVLPLVGRSG